MKKRTYFEPSDFQSRGQMIIRESSPPGSTNYGFAASVAYKVGYMPNSAGASVVLVAITDGLTREFSCIEELCDELNRDEFGYRPMTHEEVQQVVMLGGSRFPG